MDKKAKKLRPPAAVVMWVLMAVFAVASIAAIVYQVARGDMFFAGRGLFLPLLLGLPWLLGRLGIRPGYRLYCLAYAFMIFAFTYGNLMGGFKGSEVTDKVSHFLSGFLFTILGYCLYYKLAAPRLDGTRKGLLGEWGLSSSYALFFSLAVAVVWEVIEFMDYNLTGNDSQNHLTTGVFDTMEDMIAALIASVICVGSFALWRYTRVKLLTPRVVEEFYDANCLREGTEGKNDKN